MGVPAFFRWLTRKYPSVIVECTENKTIDPETQQNVYEDATLPNPNGVEFDNLYLDMNGIIHPCTHPEDKAPPKNEDEMMIAIFECIDRLFAIVRPRKVLYMAIDGVAPRAKMNQQRSRRFRAAKEAVEKRTEIERIRSELSAKGCILPPEKEKGEHFDSNCITPGTPFMDRLSHCLHYYIHDRMNNNPAWKGIKVILSDANSPGEGEHKIMDYIRKQRAQPDHDPNTQHVLCGADADLIMLGLATHEPNFTIIREEFLPNKPRPCDVCGQFGHEMDKCDGLNAADASNVGNPDEPLRGEVKFIFVRLSVLKEYLRKTLEMPNLPFKYDFERVIDDWVFMCFFVGNDFLPHLPSLEIREGAIDRLVELYKKCVYRTGGYLTDSGDVNLERVQMIMTDLGNMEDQIFKERQRREKQFQRSQKMKRARTNQQNAQNLTRNQNMLTPVAIGGGGNAGPSSIQNYKQEASNIRMDNQRGGKRTAAQAGLDNEEEEEANDEVRLWEDGFKDRYYESKFDVCEDNVGFRYNVALQYVRGLCWVLKYYYQGCASWNWYFPYHYAPFASDFVNINGLSTTFEKDTKPFNPLEQLMGVFPAASSSHVPQPWAELMSDPESNIIDFYPEDFKIDLNGKKYAWQGVALLPFVDEKRLFKALEPYYGQLTEEEVRRNKQREARLYITNHHPQFKLVLDMYKKSNPIDFEIEILLDGMRGSILQIEENVAQNGSLGSPIHGLHDITENRVVVVAYKDPSYATTFIFPAKRLQNAIDPPTVLAPDRRPNNYKPVIGFNRNLPTAHLSNAGHRMVNAGINAGQYNNNYQNNNQYNNRYQNNAQGQYGNMNRYSAPQQPYARNAPYHTNNYQNNQQRYPNNQGGGRDFNNQGGNRDYNNRYNNNYNNNNNNNNNRNAGGWRKFT